MMSYQFLQVGNFFGYSLRVVVISCATVLFLFQLPLQVADALLQLLPVFGIVLRTALRLKDQRHVDYNGKRPSISSISKSSCCYRRETDLFELVFDQGQIAFELAAFVPQLLFTAGGQIQLVQRQRILVFQFRYLTFLLGHDIFQLAHLPLCAHVVATL